MTVAATIEIGAGGQIGPGGQMGPGGHSEPGQSLPGARAAGKAQRAEWDGALGLSATTASVPAASSFRSRWQSMLASLNANLECSGNDETAVKKKDENLAATVDPSLKATGSDAATVAHASVSTSQRWGQVSAKQIASAEGEKNLFLADTEAGHSLSQTAWETLRQSASHPASKSGATAGTPSKEENTGNAHSAGAVKSVKPKAASGEIATGTAANLATVQSISVAIPAPVAEVQSPGTTEAPAQTPLADQSSQLSRAFTLGFIQQTSSFQDGLGTATIGTITSRNKASGAFDGAEAVDAPHADHSGVGAKETIATANQAMERVVIADGTQSSHTQVPVMPAAAKSANGSQVESGNDSLSGEITAVTPATQDKAATVPARTSQIAVHGELQNRNIDEAGSSTTNGLAPFAAAVETSSSEQMRPQAESKPHALADSQPRPQTQTAIQSVDAVASPVGSVALHQTSAIGNAAASQSVPPPDMNPIADKAGAASNLKTSSLQAGSRTRHTAAEVHGNQKIQAVQDGSNNAALARDLSTAHVANLSSESSAAASKGESTAHETFAALDAESSSGPATWLHAGTRTAEAGFQDPALGWVGVRADASGGGVHASLVPGSAEAAAALGGHLAGLSAFLSEQHTPVDSLTLAATEDRSANSSMGQGAQQNMHQGTHQEAGRETGQSQSSGQPSSPQASSPVMTAAAGREITASSGRAESTAQAFVSSGTHISVMA